MKKVLLAPDWLALLQTRSFRSVIEMEFYFDKMLKTKKKKCRKISCFTIKSSYELHFMETYL